MTPELTETEIHQVRQGIKEKYDRVAAAGTGGCFQYPTGKAGMELQGYPPELIKIFPRRSWPPSAAWAIPSAWNPLTPGTRSWTSAAAPGWTPWWRPIWWGPAAGWWAWTSPRPWSSAPGRSLARLGLANVTFQVGEAEALPFPDARLRRRHQ